MKLRRRWNISVGFVFKTKKCLHNISKLSQKGQMGCCSCSGCLLSWIGVGWVVISQDGVVGWSLQGPCWLSEQTIWGPLRLWRQIASPGLHKTLFPPHLDTQKTIFGFWKMSSKSWFVGRFKEMIISSKWWDGRGWQLIDRGLDKFPACLVQVLDKKARRLDQDSS